MREQDIFNFQITTIILGNKFNFVVSSFMIQRVRQVGLENATKLNSIPYIGRGYKTKIIYLLNCLENHFGPMIFYY